MRCGNPARIRSGSQNTANLGFAVTVASRNGFFCIKRSKALTDRIFSGWVNSLERPKYRRQGLYPK
jgi:hypothetical protein